VLFRSSPAAGAAACATTLKRFYGAETLDAGRPLFDLTLLGLGEDGHIASLFPGSPALAETERWALPVVGETPPDRITLTYPVLACSGATAFLVAGESKHGARARVRAGDQSLPATRLQPTGAVYWFADRAAAATPAFSAA
jgi:6-phosphogluconolactonase